MSAIETAAKVFEHSPEEMEKLKKMYFRAEVLNQSGQTLIAGSALFEDENPGRGMFFPNGEFLQGDKLNEVRNLKNSEGKEFQLSNFEFCADPSKPHYHFNWKSKTK
jgi:hypothetical protein